MKDSFRDIVPGTLVKIADDYESVELWERHNPEKGALEGYHHSRIGMFREDRAIILAKQHTVQTAPSGPRCDAVLVMTNSGAMGWAWVYKFEIA